MDGFGGDHRNKKTGAKLTDVATKAADDDHLVTNVKVRASTKVPLGSLRIVHEKNQAKKRTKLVKKSLELPSFKTVATKRKCKVDLEANTRAKCIRRTKPEELFDGHKIDVYMQKLAQSNKSG